MFSGKAEMGRDFYVKIVNADKLLGGQSREMLVMARCKGVASLQQVYINLSHWEQFVMEADQKNE